MSKRAKTKSGFNPKAPFRYSGKVNGFIPFTLDMISSDAYKALSGNEVKLLLLCYKQEIKPDLKRPEEYKGEHETEYFYFPRSLGSKFGIGEGKFSEYINRLVEVGFIDCVFQGKPLKKRNIYHYSSRWQKYGNEQGPPPANVLTDALIKKYYPPTE